MRILHTSDWHLNARLAGRDRTLDLRRRVEEVAGLCETRAADVLVIAGDLFSEQCRVDAFQNELADSLRHLRRTFRGFFDRGGVILAITGNHDQDGLIRDYLEIARAGMDLGERPRKPGDHFDRGKMYLLTRSFVGRVRDVAGYDVQFALMPFPKQSSVLTGTEAFASGAEYDRVTQQSVADWLRELPTSKGFDTRVPAVFVGHIRTVHADLGRGLKSAAADGLALDDAALPTAFAYVALGDIHKPQSLLNSSHIRYSGSLDRMDFGEAGEEKSVVLVDVNATGRVGDPQVIPLKSTELVGSRQSNRESAVQAILEQVRAAPEAIHKVELMGEAATPAVEEAIRREAPQVRVVRERLVPDVAAVAAAPQGTVRERVVQYLTESLADDPQQTDLLALALHHLDRLGHA